MDYEAEIKALKKRIDLLEGQLRKLELAHIPTRSNGKVSEKMMKVCYDAAISGIFEPGANFNKLTEQVSTRTGMNAGTTKNLIMTAYALSTGELFKPIISGKAANYFLSQIAKEGDEAALTRAVGALWLHIRHRQALGRDTSLLEKIAKKYEDINQ